jgi:ethanolamine utilization protein EutA
LGDLAFDLANELKHRLESKPQVPPIVDAQHGIRATVIGASQFTVQVSGKTIYADSLEFLPLRNVPVGRPTINLSVESIAVDGVTEEIVRACHMRDVDRNSPIALAFEWEGDPSYQRLKAIADAIDQALCSPERVAPLVVVIDGDVGRLLGRILSKELNKGANVLSLDGVVLSDLDFIDVGELISPPGVIPLVIKSLVFDTAQHMEH